MAEETFLLEECTSGQEKCTSVGKIEIRINKVTFIAYALIQFSWNAIVPKSLWVLQSVQSYKAIFELDYLRGKPIENALGKMR